MALSTSLSDLLVKIFANPISLGLFAVWTFLTYAEYFTVTHPTDYLYAKFKRLTDEGKLDLTVLMEFIGIVKAHTRISTLVSLNALTVFLTPSYTSLIIEIVYSVFLIVNESTLDFFFHLWVSIIVFLYMCVDGGRNKLVIVIIGVLTIYIKYVSGITVTSSLPTAKPPTTKHH